MITGNLTQGFTQTIGKLSKQEPLKNLFNKTKKHIL